MRRRAALMILAPVAALSLIGAGCGGGGNKTSTTDTGGGSGGGTPSSTDAAAILGAIKAGDQTKPTKLAMELAVTLNGTISNPQVAAILDGSPITLKLSGAADPTGTKADMTFDVKAGKIALPGKLRLVDAKTGFIGLGDKWYELPIDSLGSTAQTATDPSKTLAAIGNPADLLTNPTVVGAENIDGVETDHVSGAVSPEGLVKALAKVSASQGGNAPSEAEVAEAVTKLNDVVKSGKIDLWVGKDDKQIHRAKIDADVVMPADQKASTGLDGLKAVLTIQSTPTSGVTVEAPAGALPSSQLQTDLGTIILQNLGGSPTP